MTVGLRAILLYHLRRNADKTPALIAAALLAGSLMGRIALMIGVSVVPMWLGHYRTEIIAFSL